MPYQLLAPKKVRKKSRECHTHKPQTLYQLGIFFSCTAWFKECLTYIQDCCICSGEGLAMILAHSIMEISSCLRSRGRTLVITSNALQLSVLGNPGHEARLFLCILSSCPQLAIRHTWAPYSIWGITMLWYNGHFLWANRFRSSHHH